MRQASFFAVAVVVISGVLAGCAPRSTSAPTSEPVAAVPIQPELSSQEAVAWGGQHVLPVIESAVDDPIPGISQRIRKLVSWSKSGAVQITMDTGAAVPDALALTKWERRKGKPDVYLNTERLREAEQLLSQEQFRDLVLAVLCHETFHLEIHMPRPNDPEGSSPEGRAMALDGEAKAWALTVTEVLRPMQKAGRYLSPRAIKVERAFAACGNQDGPKWREWVVSQ